MFTMNKFNRAIAITVVILCTPALFAYDSIDIKLAKQALKPLKMNLMKTMSAAMKQGGPMAAIDSCQSEAPSITKKVQTAKVKVGRTSHKLRNADNKAPKWAQPQLEKYKYSMAGKLPKQQLVNVDKNTVGYLEPIYTKTMCLSCHGPQQGKEIQSKLAARYPNDNATGFKLNEFRGFFWAEVSK